MTQERADSDRMDEGDVVKWAAVGSGSLLALTGLRHGGLDGLLLAAGGGLLAYAGASGRLARVGRSATRAAQHRGSSSRSARPSQIGNSGIDVEKGVTINAPVEEIYRFWREFENLPRFMDHLQSVTKADEKRSHWVAKAPAHLTVEWDAEVTEDVPNERISWRSLEASEIPNEGSVEFRAAPGDRGTEVRVKLQYRPPVGALGAAVARLFGEEPSQQVEDDLRRFKRLMELGSVPTTEGQPSGRKSPVTRAIARVYDNRRTS